jgi:hypothetical protein
MLQAQESGDEVIFLQTTIESQLHTLVQTVERHVLSLIEPSTATIPKQRTRESRGNMFAINNLKSTLSRQTASVRNTLRFLESRCESQMANRRTAVKDSLDEEEILRHRYDELLALLQRHGISPEQSPIPQQPPDFHFSVPLSVSSQARAVDQADRPPVVTDETIFQPESPMSPIESLSEFETDLLELVALRDRLLRQVERINQFDELKRSS